MDNEHFYYASSFDRITPPPLRSVTRPPIFVEDDRPRVVPFYERGDNKQHAKFKLPRFTRDDLMTQCVAVIDFLKREMHATEGPRRHELRRQIRFYEDEHARHLSTKWFAVKYPALGR